MTDKSDSDHTESEYSSSDNKSEPFSRDQWEALDSDPDIGGDFGYDVSDWDQFETLDDTEQVIFLPSDESQLKDAAFIVAKETTLTDLEDRC